MEGFKHIKQIRAYCDYIENHLQNIDRAWLELQGKCQSMRFVYDDYVFHSIAQMVKDHDLSKFSMEEFIPYCNRFYPVDEGNCADKKPFELAWEHHKENNPHHWEHWTRKEYYNPYEWECHCVCMVIDWMAMGYKFGDTAQEYYENNADKINLPAHAVEFIGEIFDRLKPQPEGEETP